MTSGESKPELHLEIAHVLLMDVVGYSKLLINDQSETLEQLNRVVRDTSQFQEADAAGKLIRLATGDGIALVFFNNPEAPVKCALEITQALQSYSHIQLRMGVHTGPINPISDVNNRTNVTGAGINMAQRVMDCGDAGHILVSRRVAEDLEHYRHWQPHLHNLGECEVKHGLRVEVVNLYGDGFGNAKIPEKITRAAQERAAAAVAAVRSRHKRVVAGLSAAFVLLLCLGLGIWQLQRRGAVPAAAKLEAAGISKKGVAVLPFENLSMEAADAVVAAGIHREVLSDLAKLNDLKVISRTSVMQYKPEAPRNLKEIARELGVSHVVEGSVQRAGQRVHVTAQLIDATSDSHVWAETYDRKLTDVFAIQGEIAQKIADQLGVRLSAQERTDLAKKPTQNLEAFEYYTRARALMETEPDNFAYEENLTKARALLEQAVAKDPQFLLGYATLAEANIQLYRARHGQEDLPHANAALREAYRVAPEAGETYFGQALIYYYGQNDFDRALASLELAARSLPNSAQVFMLRGLLERRMGRWEESLRHFKQAIEIDPKDDVAYGHAAGGASALRRYQEADRILDAAIAAFPHEADNFRAWKGLLACWREGDTKKARAQLEKIQRKAEQASVMLGFIVPFYERNYAEAEEATKDFAKETAHADIFFPFQVSLAVATNTVERRRASLMADLARSAELNAKTPDNYHNLQNAALLNAALGNKEDAVRAAKRAAELYPVSQDALVGPEQLCTLATAYAWTGEKDLAFQTLFTVLKLPHGVSYGELKLNPDWDNLRTDPRFEQLLAEAAKPFNQMAH